MANTIRIKRRDGSGASGAPSSLANAELAFSEVDDILYYGKGTGGAGGSATTVVAIAGSGSFVTLSGAQTISGNKTFSGTNTATTAAVNTNTTQIATTAFVLAQGNATNATITMNGAQAAGTSNLYARADHVHASDTSKANLASPTFTGTPAAPTAAVGDNTTQIATTAFVKSQNYLIGNQTITLSGDATGSGTTAITVTLKNDVATAGTATKVTFNSKGLVTSGTSLLASDIPTLTAAKISDFDTQVRTSRLDQMTAPTGPVGFNGQRILNVAAPELPTDAVNKQYADSIVQSLNVHGAADFATTASVSYAYASGGTSLTITTITGTDTITFSANHGLSINSQIRTGDVVTGTGLAANTTYYVTSEPALNQVKLSASFGGSNAVLTNGTGLSIGVTGDPGVGATLSGCPNSVDSGATLILGNRILVKDHATAAYNGTYVVTTVGAGANGVWTRAADFDNGPTGEITSGDYVFVAGGTINGNNGFIQTSPPPIRMGRSGAGYTAFTGDSLSFTQFSGAGQITAGAGMTKSGNTLDVGAGTGIAVAADTVGLTGQALALHNLATDGIFVRTGAGTVAARSVATSGTGISVANGNGVAANPTLSLSAALSTVGGLTPAADRIAYYTDASTAALTTLTTFGRSLIDDADAAAGRTTLGLGTMATQGAGAVAITGGTIDGITFDGGTF